MKRLPALLFGIFIVCIVVLFFHSRQSVHSNIWMLESCKVSDRDPDRPLVGRVHLTLRGPSAITATQETGPVCALPPGTQFFRDGGYVCIEGHGDTASTNAYCYEIESEKAK